MIISGSLVENIENIGIDICIWKQCG